MIVRKHLRWHLVLQKSFPFWATIVVLASGVLAVHKSDTFEPYKSYTQIPFPIVGMLATALAIFLAFRNNTAYDRWWEAPKIWGGVVNASRSFARQITSLTGLSELPADQLDAIRQEFVYRHLAWVNVLRLQLRRQWEPQDVEPFLKKDEFEWLLQRQNRATQLVQKQGEQLAAAFRQGALIDTRSFDMLDATLTELTTLQGQAERIKNTPLPRQYDYFPRVFLYLFVVLMPFGIVEELEHYKSEWLVIPLTTVIAFVFYVLMKVGEFNEDPFENRISDTPMTALCRTIEIDLREQLGETKLPPPIDPTDGILL